MYKIILATVAIILLNSCSAATCLKVQLPLPKKLDVKGYNLVDLRCADINVQKDVMNSSKACMDRVKTLRDIIKKSNGIN